MDSSKQSSPAPEGQNPYINLGLEPGASFEEIQAARDSKLSEAGEDVVAKAKIEASYDALLMVSLKERQLGKLSNEALNASQKEKQIKNESQQRVLSSIGDTFKKININNGLNNNSSLNLDLIDGQGFAIRVVLGLIALLLILISPPSNIQLILSVSTIGLFISQVRRGRKLVSSLGWSVVTLAIGLIIGDFILKYNSYLTNFNGSISPQQIEALPAVILIWIASLFLA